MQDAHLPMTSLSVREGSDWPAVSPASYLLGTKEPQVIGVSRSRRRAARWNIKRAAASMVSLQFGLLSALALGFERLNELTHQSWVGGRLSKAQRETAQSFFQQARLLSRVRGSPCAGGQARLEAAIVSLDVGGEYHLGRLSPGSSLPQQLARSPEKGLPGDLCWLTAEALDLPEIGACIPAKDWLSEPTLQMWCDPASLHAERETLPAKPALLCSDSEWMKVLDRLRRRSLLSDLPLSKIPRDPSGALLTAGAFGIIKNATRLRFIIDRRPANHYERQLPGLNLPHGVCFTKFLLGPGEILRLHLRDASNYYYLLEVPEERLPFQGVGPPVSKEWWDAGCPSHWSEEKAFRGEDLIQPVFRAVIMGDTNGVVVGQEVHRNMLLRNHVFLPQEEVQYHQPAPQGKTWAGVYIDDFGVAQAVSSKRPQDRGRDHDIMEKADAVYEEVGIPVKEEKKLQNLPSGKIWGAHLGAEPPSVGVDVTKLLTLANLTWALLAKGSVTKRLMCVLTGNWGFPLQFRRCLMSLFQYTFKWTEALPEHVPCCIPPNTFDELLAVSLMCNHMHADISQEICRVIGATDASPEGLGACQAKVPATLAKTLFCRADLRGERTTLGGVLQPEPAGRSRPSVPRGPSRHVLVAVHLFSGPRRMGDVHHWWSLLSTTYGVEIALEDYDICILVRQHDLTREPFFRWLLGRAERGQINWVLGGPPCGTWSRARFSPKPGPPPVRTREHPWGLPNLSRHQQHSVEIGTTLLLNYIEICRAVASAGGFYILEHPEDPGCAPYPSIWVVQPLLDLLRETGGRTVGLHQSAFDRDSTRKDTRLASNLEHIDTLARRGSLGQKLPPLIGIDPKTKKFKTSQAQVYRPGLCKALVHAFELQLTETPMVSVCDYNTAEKLPGAPSDFTPLPLGHLHSDVQPDHSIAELVCDWDWRTVFSHAASDHSHINLKELRAARLYLKRHAKSKNKKNGRVIILLDSQVARGALTRGRSPSYPINRQLRRLVPTLIGGKIFPTFLWIPSKANPSDPPSRFRPLWSWLKDARAAKRLRRMGSEPQQLQ